MNSVQKAYSQVRSFHTILDSRNSRQRQRQTTLLIMISDLILIPSHSVSSTTMTGWELQG